MDLNAKVKKSAICAGVSVVQSARFGWFSNKTIKKPNNNSFAVAYNNKAYALFSSRRLR